MIWPFKRQTVQDTQAGLVLDPVRGGSLAVVQQKGSRLRLRQLATCPPPADGDWRPELAGLLDDCRVPLNLVVNDDTYQLLLVERPDVPANEIAGAVRWRIREMLDYPVEESVVDVFDVPPQARGSRNMIYAVASRRQAIDGLVEQVNDAGGTIGCIDIAELCMRNIATCLEQDRFGVALLLARGHQGVLTVSRDKKLYLIRQMEISAEAGDETVSSVALELQRSLDYFESHYDQRPIRDVVLAPSADGVNLSQMLGRDLAVNVSLLDLNELLETSEELTAEDQERGLLAMGAAMRGPEVLEAAA